MRTDRVSVLLLSLAVYIGCDAENKSTTDKSQGNDSATHSHADPAPWQLSPVDSLSQIPGGTSHAELAERYGKEELLEGESYMGEGETAPATILFPDDPTRHMEIVWSDPQTRSGVERITVRGEKSNWYVLPGITLGTTLDSLVRLNGKPITFYGFDWDYGGTIADWNGGRLAEMESQERRVLLRLGYDHRAYETLSEKERGEISGDRKIGSEDPAVRKAGISVREILVVKAP